MSGSVIVIGGGVVGVSCAYYLSKAGWSVSLLDRATFGSGCSHGNCGLIVPSHVLPLAEPGAVRRALRGLFTSTAPLSIRPRADPALWLWLFRFAQRCNHDDMVDAGRGIKALLDSSRSLYDELMASEPLDCEWEARGLLYVYRTRAGMEKHAATDRLVPDLLRVPANRYDGEELTIVEPALKSGLAGGWHYPGDAHLRPDKLLRSWVRVLEQRGVLMHEGCEVHEFVTRQRRGTAINTAKGPMTADAFVVATGAWTPRFARALGCRIPIQPGKGYSITMRRPTACPTIPLLFPDHGVAVTPMQSGYRLGSILELGGDDRGIRPERVEYLKAAASSYLVEPYCEPTREEWYGWRPMTYDGKPVIDRSPAMSNVVIAAGHNMLGLSMAPATGKLVAELLSGRLPHVEPSPYRVSRF